MRNNEINTENLHVGQIYKNYKQLCAGLNEEVLNGCSKKSQLKNWCKYFKWERDGVKYVITKICGSNNEEE